MHHITFKKIKYVKYVYIVLKDYSGTTLPKAQRSIQKKKHTVNRRYKKNLFETFYIVPSSFTF